MESVRVDCNAKVNLFLKILARREDGYHNIETLFHSISLHDTLTLRETDSWWDDFLADDDTFAAVACDPDDVTCILSSSGTTGEPKAIPYTHTTPIKIGADGHLHLDIKPGQVVAWPTSIGWMMGSWLIYASLLNRATMALFRGSPVGREFCEFVQNAKVEMLGVIPSMVTAWRNADAPKGLDWSSVKVYGSTGECSNPEDYLLLGLLIMIAITGNHMRFVVEPDTHEVRDFLQGLFRLKWQPAPVSAGISFVYHFAFVQLLMLYFPFSKLMHTIGSLFSKMVTRS